MRHTLLRITQIIYCCIARITSSGTIFYYAHLACIFLKASFGNSFVLFCEFFTLSSVLLLNIELEQILVLIFDHIWSTVDRFGAGLFLWISTGPTALVSVGSV